MTTHKDLPPAGNRGQIVRSAPGEDQKRNLSISPAAVLPIVPARVSDPIGRQTLPMIIVLRCPACAHSHVHRAGSKWKANGAVRRGSCGTEYVISVGAA